MLCFLGPVPDSQAGLVGRCLVEDWWAEAQDGVEEQLCETGYLETARDALSNFRPTTITCNLFTWSFLLCFHSGWNHI